MYRKHFYDFKLTPSDNPRTRRKQETRFKPKCNRVFRSGKSDLLDNINDKLGAGRRYRFLFLGSQHIHKPIHHLKYKNFRYKSFPDHKDYSYEIPSFSHIGVVDSKDNVSASISSRILPVQPTKSLPGPSSPVVVNTIPEFLSAAEIAALGPSLPPLPENDSLFQSALGYNSFDPTRLGWSYYLQYDPDHPNLPPKICVRGPDPNAVNAAVANYHGTTSKHSERRLITTKRITNYNNTFHDHMTWASRPIPTNKSKNWRRLRREYQEFMSVPYQQRPIPRHRQKYFIDIPDNYTSDETERVEYRPLKRNIISYSSTPASHPPHIKRIRHTIGSSSDSPVAGQMLNDFICHFITYI
ncbi:7836_t:CDS:1 [Rhizophagus irregularis]|nr:7836_t:CDS:1 [Rhizophagus irregularis]